MARSIPRRSALSCASAITRISSPTGARTWPHSQIAAYRSIADAAAKAEATYRAIESYLLGAFLSRFGERLRQPTTQTAAPYQPVHVHHAGELHRTDYVQANNSAYVSALTALQTSLDRVAKAGNNVKDDMVAQTMNDATNGYRVTRQIAQNFRIDHEGNVARDGAEADGRSHPPGGGDSRQAGSGATQYRRPARMRRLLALAKKYPFDTNSKTDATLAGCERSIFRPGDGRLPQFYDNTLKNYLELQGNEYVRKPDSRVQITDAFLRFFNRAMAFSDALYKGGAKDPSIAYSDARASR